jgi:hypothetical protein
LEWLKKEREGHMRDRQAASESVSLTRLAGEANEELSPGALSIALPQSFQYKMLAKSAESMRK